MTSSLNVGLNGFSSRAAVPGVLSADFNGAPPGLRSPLTVACCSTGWLSEI